MSYLEEMRRLQSLQDTAANAQGQIDQQMKNRQAEAMSVAQENLGYLAVQQTVQQPPR